MVATTVPVETTIDFESSVLQHQAMVFSIAYHFLRDRSLAEELAQDVFLELYLHLDQIQSADHLRFWLRRGASQRCIDQARKKGFRKQVCLADAPEPFVWMPAADPMLKTYIGQLVAALTEVPRMIVILRYQEDLAPAEIAEVLDMPVATVKSHLQRALALLRRKVEATSAGGVR